MPSLLEVQRAFAEALLAGDAPGDRSVHAHIRPGRFEPGRHLGVYRNNVYATLTEALTAVHPVVRRLVGEDFFGYAAEHYVRADPPRSGNLHDFGASFAAFLETFEPAGSLAYLPDVARLEWAWHEAFHAPEAEPLSIDRLARIPPADYPRLCFALHPSARLVVSRYPVLRIWEVNQPEFEGEGTVNLDEGGSRVLAIRRALSVELESLSEAELAMLSRCAEGADVEAATEAVLAHDSAFDLAGALRRYAADGTIVDFSLRQTE